MPESPIERIALLHYTGLPAVGGVESLIDLQREALLDLGHDVTLVVGEGSDPSAGRIIRLPEIHPSHPAVVEARAALTGTIPLPDHPLVRSLEEQLRPLLAGHTQCWVHNAFTVYLNPFLSVALARLTHEPAGLRWVAWCADLSEVSAFWPPLTAQERDSLAIAPDGVTYVAISQARRAELSRLRSLAEGDVRVVHPPLDALDWLGIGPITRTLITRLRFDRADPLILVPAKVLPHKNLALAVHVAAQLQSLGKDPAILVSGATSPHEADVSRTTANHLTTLSRELGIEDRIHLLPRVLGHHPDRRTLRDLMLLADLVFIPSGEEGFGVPLLEAAALRVPVLCSDIPAFREAGADIARYFGLGDDPAVIAQQIMDMTSVAMNQRRRAVLGSADEFRRQLQELATLRDSAGSAAT